MLSATGGGFGTSGLGLVPESPGPGRMRASVEAVLVYHLMDVLEERLKTEKLFNPFIRVCFTSYRTFPPGNSTNLRWNYLKI